MHYLDPSKRMEIDKMVTILQQIEVADIELLTRDANTLLMRKKREERESQPRKTS